MHSTAPIFDDRFDDWSEAIQSESAAAKRLPGLYPWLQFDLCTRAQWAEEYGIDLERIHERAAKAYLRGEEAFLQKFERDCGSALHKQHVTDLRQRTLENHRCQFNHAAAKLCQSPIEQLMLAGLVWSKFGCEDRVVEIWDSKKYPAKPQTDVVIAPQYQIENYFVDFAIFIQGFAKEEIKVVVECDGHNTHEKEKTKDQAARYKKRERVLEIAGWKLLRFTGSEIWQDHRARAGDVSMLATNELNAQLRRRGVIK
jgi:very-short-patch-repair endonuclease